MSATPTGRHERRDDIDVLVWRRTFHAPVEDVWAAVTVPERLARWIGTWTGDPAEGHVSFAMTAEGEDVPASRWDVLECTPPRRLHVRAVDEHGTWDLTLELEESGGTTTLAFSQVVDDPATIDSTGPGWDYYLDRLVAAEAGDDPGALDFERDYFPAQQAHYAAIAATLARRDI